MRTILLLLLISLPTYSKSPITHETMWLMKRVGAPAPSPDGAWIVFPVTEPAYDLKDTVSDLWLVPANQSSPPRRLTHTKAAESAVHWSPDSKSIAFSTKREGDEDAQIYILSLSGGEAARLTQSPGGAAGPKFSPDGKSILFSTQAKDRTIHKYNARVYDSFPVRNWDHWLDESTPRLHVRSLTAGAKERDLLSGTGLAASPGFNGAGSDSGADLQPVWSPDSSSIVFIATTNHNASAYAPVLTQLYQVPAAGGEPKRITAGKDSYANPYFSPDGALYAIEEKNTPKVYSLSRIVRITASAAHPVTASLDRSITTFAVHGSTLYALGEEHGHEKLFAFPAQGGPAMPALLMTSGTYFNLAIPAKAAQPALYANFESAISPSEIVRIDPVTGGHQRLTSFNTAAASGIDWLPARHFWFTSKAGRKIHNMITLPPAFDPIKKYPLVVFIHGGPHTMSRDQFHQRWNVHLLASPGYVILTTNYTGSTGFGEAFSQAIQGDPLKTPGEEINQAVDEALKQFPFIDGTRMAAGGASYGGHLANWLQATTTRFKCLYAHAGLINLESQWGTSDTIYHREINNGGPVWEQGPVWRTQNPIRYAANFKTPILLTAGERDFRVPLNQTLENWSVLQRLRIPSRLIVFPDENHWILKGENNRFFYQQLLAWLAQHFI
ncbi:MAG: S9 family peptidase [Acidobacteriia bacterium]|nr:S9 family peptidase [Terriglobia bacterium]